MPAIRAMGWDATGLWIEPNWLSVGQKIRLPAVTIAGFVGTASQQATSVKNAFQTLTEASRAGGVVVAVDPGTLEITVS